MRTTNTTNIRIDDLPDGILTNVVTYLAAPSIVLMSFALTQDGASSNQLLTQTTNAIMSAATSSLNDSEQKQLQVLDFGDIEKSLAAKLTDDHITAIFNCIDAPNYLKTLKLAGCVNITGSCLESIRTSVVELLDLSLVGEHERPYLAREPLLSESVVIPILDSIISNSRTLKLLHLPHALRTEQSQEMEQFLGRYNIYLETFRYPCSGCAQLCESTGDENESWIVSLNYLCAVGTQNYTCAQCLAHFCDDRNCTDAHGDAFALWCHKCTKLYCKECVNLNICGCCGGSFCYNCDALEKGCEGGSCERNLCKSCVVTCKCTYCGQTICHRCTRNYHCGRPGCTVVCGNCLESRSEEEWHDELNNSNCSSCAYDILRKAFPTTAAVAASAVPMPLEDGEISGYV